MDKIKEILNSLKERFNSPLFFSFLCAWVAINWEITIALIRYDPIQIEKENCASIFAFIKWKLNTNDSVIYPLIVALIYTFIYPFVKTLIRLFYAWIEKVSENFELSINSNGKVSIEKYIKIKKNYDQRSKLLEEIIETENTTQNEYQSLKTKLFEVENKNIELRKEAELTFMNHKNQSEDVKRQHQAEIELANRKYQDGIAAKEKEILNITDSSILDGFWTNTYESTILAIKGSENIFIKDNKYYLVDSLGKHKHVFNIVNFHLDTGTGSISFVKVLVHLNKPFDPISGQLKYLINDLKILNDKMISGSENGYINVMYERISLSSKLTSQ